MSKSPNITHQNVASNAAGTESSSEQHKMLEYPIYLAVPGISKQPGIELVKGSICKLIMQYLTSGNPINFILFEVRLQYPMGHGDTHYGVRDITSIIQECQRLGLHAGTPLAGDKWEAEEEQEDDRDCQRWGVPDIGSRGGC